MTWAQLCGSFRVSLSDSCFCGYRLGQWRVGWYTDVGRVSVQLGWSISTPHGLSSFSKLVQAYSWVDNYSSRVKVEVFQVS